MNVVMVNADTGVPPDGTKGAAAHLRGVAAAMVRRGHRVILFSARLPSQRGGFPCDVRPLVDLPGAASLGGPPDVVYERYSIGHLAGLRCAERSAIPFLLEVNAPLLLEAEAHRAYTPRVADVAAEHELFRRASVVIAVSTWLARYVGERRGHRHNVVTIPNGFDPAMFPEQAPVDGRHGQVIALLGNPKPWHGAHQLPGALAVLAAQGLDPKLMVIGGGPGAGALVADAVACGVSERVEVTGPLDQTEATRRLGEAVVGVAPYAREPMFYFSPLKVVEYMAAGLPVVTTDQGDLAEMVGGGGIVVSPDSTRELVDALAALLLDSPRRRTLGHAARSRAFGSMTWDAVVRRMEDALQPLTAIASP